MPLQSMVQTETLIVSHGRPVQRRLADPHLPGELRVSAAAGLLLEERRQLIGQSSSHGDNPGLAGNSHAEHFPWQRL